MLQYKGEKAFSKRSQLILLLSWKRGCSWLSMSSKEENKESCLDVRLSINICKNYSVKVQKLADISK